MTKQLKPNGDNKWRRSISRVSWILFALLCAACYDFTDPDFPEAGAPAVFQINAIRVADGRLFLNAQLAPGLSIGGIQRSVLNDTIVVFGARFEPDSTRRNGTRVYDFNGPVPAELTAPLSMQAPAIAELTSSRPSFTWYPIRKTDADTIVRQKSAELVLRVDTTLGISTPLPAIRQWFLDLHGETRSFRISSDGAPPTTLRVPLDFIPADSVVTVNLSFTQAGQLFSPARDYIANVSYTMFVRWVVRTTGS